MTTVAGTGSTGDNDGPIAQASFHYPDNVAPDKADNIYVADTYNHKIRKISSSGIVSTLAGSGIAGNANGQGNSASFNYPFAIQIDSNNNAYVSDLDNNTIRKISQSGAVSTFAGTGTQGFSDGTISTAQFFKPAGICSDAFGNIYLAEIGNNCIRKISPSGIVSTVAGSGNKGATNGGGQVASFDGPYGVAVHPSGNMYVSDGQNMLIRKITFGYTISPLLPAGLRFDPATGTIDGIPTVATTATTYTIVGTNENGNDTVLLHIATTIPTPVTLTSFSAKATEAKLITLKWQTATETNADRLVVEHSSDGNGNAPIGNLKAIGNWANNYRFVDSKATEGFNYYRLKMVGKNGESSYSEEALVSLTPESVTTITLALNPVNDFMIVIINSLVSEKAVLHILNAAGQIVKKITISLEQGRKIETISTKS